MTFQALLVGFWLSDNIILAGNELVEHQIKVFAITLYLTEVFVLSHVNSRYKMDLSIFVATHDYSRLRSVYTEDGIATTKIRIWKEI